MDTLAGWSGFVISLGLLSIAACSRKIVRGTAFRASDFYLGIDLTLAAISVGAVNVVEVVTHIGPGNQKQAVYSLLYTVFCFAAFVVQLALHQEDRIKRNRKGLDTALARRLVLLLGVNSAGAALLVLFVRFKFRGIL